MMTSSALSSATGSSTRRPSQISMRAAANANDEAGAASPVCPISIGGRGLGDRAGEFLQRGPGLVAVFRLPLLVEAGRLQLVAEGLRLDLDELHASSGEVGLEGFVLLEDVGALVERGLVEVLRDHVTHVGRQR